jgi:hypothetical protein
MTQMRSQMMAVAALLSVVGGSMAMAATTTDGTIKALDMKAHTITLADGSAYMLPATFKDPGLKVGEKVAVVWELKGTTHEASAVTVLK